MELASRANTNSPPTPALPEENNYGHRQRVEWIATHLDRSDRGVEFRFGTGYFITYPLLAWGYRVVGVDLDEASIRAGRELLAAAGLDPGATDERLRQLVAAGQAVRVARNLHIHPEPLAGLEARIVAICERDGRATIAGVRDELGTSRRYAQAVLEHLDAKKVTRREGDTHVLRGRHAAVPSA